MAASIQGSTWSSGALWHYGGLALAVIILIGLAVLLTWLIRSQMAIRRAVGERFAGKNVLLIDRTAHFFGLESAGLRQFRGKGMLVLSDEELFFIMLISKSRISIPLPLITGIENPRSFLGKSLFKPLLKVNFRTEQGSEDSVAWYIKDLDQVQDQLEKALGR